MTFSQLRTTHDCTLFQKSLMTLKFCHEKSYNCTVDTHIYVSIHRVICLKICCESSGWTVSVEKSSSAKIDFPPKCSLNSNNLLNSLPIVCLALTFATNCNIRIIQHIVWIKEILSLYCQGNKYWSKYIPQKEGCGPIKDLEIIS